jgi:dUTP pyrophosphatase
MRERGFKFISNRQMVEDIKKAIEVNDYSMMTGELRVLEYKINDLEYNKGLRDLECFTFPKRATMHSAGHDLYLPIDIRLSPGEVISLPLGIKAYMQIDESMDIYPRSGLGFKYFIRLANTIGLIDSDYYNNRSNEGSIWIKIRNEGDKVLELKRDEAIAQARFSKYLIADSESFDEGDLREGGMGSTSSGLSSFNSIKEDTFDDKEFIKTMKEAKKTFNESIKEHEEFAKELQDVDLDDEKELKEFIEKHDLDKSKIVTLDTLTALGFDD